MFTGDRSGDFLYRAMYAAGFASQPVSIDAGDGLRLIDAVITAPVHCAPPANRPDPHEIDACAPWLDATVELMPNLRGVVALGSIAFAQTLRLFERRGWMTAAHRPRPKFSHGAMARFGGEAPFILASYHPSQQNTFTGRLTQRMLTEVFRRAARQFGRR